MNANQALVHKLPPFTLPFPPPPSSLRLFPIALHLCVSFLLLLILFGPVFDNCDCIGLGTHLAVSLEAAKRLFRPP